MSVSLWLASRLHFYNVHPEPMLFFLSFFCLFFFSLACPSQRHTFPKSKHSTVIGVCKLIIKDHWRKRREKNTQKEKKTTTDSELFSSAFNLIIYFCVVKNFGFVQIRIISGGGGSDLLCQIISLLPFWCSAPLTHSCVHIQRHIHTSLNVFD